MLEIRPHSDHVTQITTAEVEDGQQQDELLRLMIERSRFMSTQPGFISISLHRSLEWQKGGPLRAVGHRQDLEAAHRAPQFREKWPQVGKAAEDIEPALYEVVHVEG